MDFTVFIGLIPDCVNTVCNRIIDKVQAVDVPLFRAYSHCISQSLPYVSYLSGFFCQFTALKVVSESHVVDVRCTNHSRITHWCDTIQKQTLNALYTVQLTDSRITDGTQP